MDKIDETAAAGVYNNNYSPLWVQHKRVLLDCLNLCKILIETVSKEEADKKSSSTMGNILRTKKPIDEDLQMPYEAAPEPSLVQIPYEVAAAEPYEVAVAAPEPSLDQVLHEADVSSADEINPKQNESSFDLNLWDSEREEMKEMEENAEIRKLKNEVAYLKFQLENVRESVEKNALRTTLAIDKLENVTRLNTLLVFNVPIVDKETKIELLDKVSNLCKEHLNYEIQNEKVNNIARLVLSRTNRPIIISFTTAFERNALFSLWRHNQKCHKHFRFGCYMGDQTDRKRQILSHFRKKLTRTKSYHTLFKKAVFVRDELHVTHRMGDHKTIYYVDRYNRVVKSKWMN